jgi:hypothetical protein
MLTAAVVDGVLYAFGGNNAGYFSTVFAYDPVMNSWNFKASMPTRRAELAAGVIDGRVYAVGGLLAPTFPSQATPKLESFIDLAWGSSNTAVATVAQYGLVTAQANGNATVTARVGGITCLAGVVACAAVTVATIPDPPPASCATVTFVLQPRSVVVSEVTVTVLDLATWSLNTITVPIGEPISVEAGRYWLYFHSGDGFLVTPIVHPLRVECGDDLTVRVNVHRLRRH